MSAMSKQQIFDLLKKNKTKFEYQEHIPIFTVKDAQDANIQIKGTVLKNLFVKDKKGAQYFLVCVPKDTSVDLAELSAAFGAKGLGLASPERMMSVLGIAPGSVSPFSALADANIPIVWDKKVKDSDIVGVHPNDNSCTVWLKSMDLQMLLMKNGNLIVKKDF